MAGRRSAGQLATAAALTLPLWLASCAPGFDPSPNTRVPAGATGVDRVQPVETPLVPIPQPQVPPPADKSPAEVTTPAGSPPAAPSTDGLGGPAEPFVPGAGGPQPGGIDTGPGAKPGKSPADRNDPPRSPNIPSSRAAEAPPGEPLPAEGATAQTVTAYYVLLDDGGASGVRFGCNDSLAEVPRSMPPSAEPLGAAMRALLDGSAEPAPGAYNALSESTLTFLSGTFDGTTVTAYLSGTIRPSGACDIPRIEAQLTQTAVTSVGAIRAEIYVNGMGLTEALSLK